jgi:hypothetical protein
MSVEPVALEPTALELVAPEPNVPEPATPAPTIVEPVVSVPPSPRRDERRAPGDGLNLLRPRPGDASSAATPATPRTSQSWIQVSSEGDSLRIRLGSERRVRERREKPRATDDRRRTDRRRTMIRTVALTSMAFALPALTSTIEPDPKPSVTVTINSFALVPPWRKYDLIIDEAARLHDLDPALIRSVMQTESAFDPRAVSPAGAQGLMQLMPAVTAQLKVRDPFDPRQNIMAGARYLRWLLDRHDGNVRLALASYNAGFMNVARYRGIPPFRETRNYVGRVTDLVRKAKSRESS